jgi:hypothetical protein
MAFFFYGTPTRRHLRKNVWLRVSALPENILAQANKHLGKTENIEWVIITDILPKNKVVLEFWCRKRNSWKPNKPQIYKVFHLLVDENPEWVCESDLGRGYKE